jgi:hypothetical protein
MNANKRECFVYAPKACSMLVTFSFACVCVYLRAKRLLVAQNMRGDSAVTGNVFPVNICACV